MARLLEELRDEAMQLSIEERSWLAHDLFDSLRSDEEREIAAEWIEVAERRIDEIEAGTAKLIPAEDVIRELKAKYASTFMTRRVRSSSKDETSTTQTEPVMACCSLKQSKTSSSF
jgi:putative addiction module component (TIGR02574 family)